MTEKPNPRVNEINRTFWEGCNERRRSSCSAAKRPSCGRFVYFPRVCCPYCHERRAGMVRNRRAAGASLATHASIDRQHHGSFFSEAPYYFLAVELAEGPLIYSRLDGDPASEEGTPRPRGRGHVRADHTRRATIALFPARLTPRFTAGAPRAERDSIGG